MPKKDDKKNKPTEDTELSLDIAALDLTPKTERTEKDRARARAQHTASNLYHDAWREFHMDNVDGAANLIADAKKLLAEAGVAAPALYDVLEKEIEDKRKLL